MNLDELNNWNAITVGVLDWLKNLQEEMENTYFSSAIEGHIRDAACKEITKAVQAIDSANTIIAVGVDAISGNNPDKFYDWLKAVTDKSN